MYEKLGINIELKNMADEVESELKEIFLSIDKIKEINSLKVLSAFQKYNLSELHFSNTTGYGYSDVGREVIEKIFADIFQAEDSLVRTQFISGTHALTVALFSILRPNDTFISINGKPYDTLDKVIGISENESSLKSYNINYEQIDLLNEDFDYEKIKERLKKGNIKLICIQRSRGYENRKSIPLESIQKVIKLIKEISPKINIMIDNCYGEFVDKIEPIELGADIIVGSLIKNLGAGIAPNGAYIAGKKELIKLAAERLTSPGLGKEVGPTLGINKQILQGLFFAPEVVSNSLKTAIFASKILNNLGYKVNPKYDEKRTDIVQAIEFGDKEKLIRFCQGIQKGSPIDSNVIPEPSDMPGYDNQIIMASGSFISGSSIELSCDAPIKSPYIAFLQGGLTYEYGKFGVLKAIQNINNIK